jgi:hypothetical protein
MFPQKRVRFPIVELPSGSPLPLPMPEPSLHEADEPLAVILPFKISRASTLEIPP